MKEDAAEDIHSLHLAVGISVAAVHCRSAATAGVASLETSIGGVIFAATFTVIAVGDITAQALGSA